MEYIIHVIDEACHFKKNDEDEFQLSEGKSSDEKKYGLAIRYDSFYFVEADDPTKAVMIVAEQIKMKDENGEEQSLSKLLEVSSKEKDKSILKLSIHNIKTIDRATSALFSSSCRILHKEKTEDDEEEKIIRVEVHELYFYIIPKTKIIYLNKDDDKKGEQEEVKEDEQEEVKEEKEEVETDTQEEEGTEE